MSTKKVSFYLNNLSTKKGKSSFSITPYINRKLIPPYRAFFTWDIHYECNYNCSYCNALKPSNPNFIKAFPLSINRWEQIWDELYGRYGGCQIMLSGGEPFIYPSVIELISYMSKKHTFEFTTNLSWNENLLIENVNPDRVRVGASFHPEFEDFEIFLRKLKRLKEKKFAVWVNYVAFPPILKQINIYKEALKKVGIPLSILPFNGTFQERSYPAEYTQEDEKFLRDFDYCADINKIIADWKLSSKNRETHGNVCRMGQMYAKILPSGDAYRCCGSYEESNKLGNLVNGTFSLLEEALPCESKQCNCWKCMLVGQEKKWESQWVTPEFYKSDKEKVYYPEYPRLDAPYRVFWNWEITYNCSYKCAYCPIWHKNDGRFINCNLKDWETVWDNIFDKYGSCHIRFSGGEPSTYPDFVDLLVMLSKKHTLEISTNLTFDITTFIKKINHEQIVISSSFHPEFISLEIFLEKVLLLRKNGYDISVTCVAYPPYLEKLRISKSKIEEKGIKFTIQHFTGQYLGRTYPDSYTGEESSFLNELAVTSLNNVANVKIQQWRSEERRTNGMLCRMGQMYAKIFPDGRVYRCCSDKSKYLGNILDKNFKLLDKPEPCESESCPCWKSMLVGCEEDKWLPLWSYPEHKIYKKR